MRTKPESSRKQKILFVGIDKNRKRVASKPNPELEAEERMEDYEIKDYSYDKLTNEQKQQVEIVQDFDMMCQRLKSPYCDELSNIYQEAGEESSGSGWASIAYYKPWIFKRAYDFAVENRY